MTGFYLIHQLTSNTKQISLQIAQGPNVKMSTPPGLQLWDGLAIVLLSSLKKSPQTGTIDASLETESYFLLYNIPFYIFGASQHVTVLPVQIFEKKNCN